MVYLLSILSTFAVLSGFLSAFYWFKASKVFIIPMEKINGEYSVLPIENNEDHWLKSAYDTFEKAGKLNKKAAIYTALAVFFSTVASLLSIYLNNA